MSRGELTATRHLRTASARLLAQRTHSERGSATLHVILACVVLSTALTVAVLWAAVSTARHKVTAAADLTALSAANSLVAGQPDELPAAAPTEPASFDPVPLNPAQFNFAPVDLAPFSPVPLDLVQFSSASLNPVQFNPVPLNRVPFSPVSTAPACVTAARVAAANGVRLVSCEVTSGAVTVEVSLQVELRLARPTVTARARAGPV